MTGTLKMVHMTKKGSNDVDTDWELNAVGCET